MTLASSPREAAETVHGRLQNLSRGGLCILADKALSATAAVLCEIIVPELPVPVPVLANVRWSERCQNNGGQLYGLQFLC